MGESSVFDILEHREKETPVSAKIGEGYKDWKQGDIILISAPTGSGKSSFILNVLLEHVICVFIEHKEYYPIYYFVNRKILQEQLLEDLHHKVQPSLRRKLERKFGRSIEDLDVDDFITIETYQSIESKCKDFNTVYLHRELIYGRVKKKYDQKFAYTVYDECHYFLSDSLYNSATQLSFACLTHVSDQNIQIYMSATMKDIKMVIRERYSKENVNLPYAYYNGLDTYHGSHTRMWSIKEYPVQGTSYKNINIKALQNRDSIKPLILDNMRKGKWLIFVDSINNGKELCKSLSKEEALKENVVFIDAEYENNPEASESVDEVVKKKYIDKKVVICTSVLDNGVSFHDKDLRNVIILTDTEEEFIQMLGRKRFDNKPIDLYIVKRNRKFFTDRLNNIKKTRNILISYQNEILQLIHPISIKQAFYQVVSDLGKENQLYEEVKKEINTYLNCFHQGGNPKEGLIAINSKVAILEDEHIKRYNSLVEQWKSFISIEEKYERCRQKFSDLLFTSEYLYYHIRKFCFIAGNSYFINRFSVRRLELLEKYYDDMSEVMRVDENAFLKMQASWIGCSFEDIEIISDEQPLTVKERDDAYSDIETSLSNWLGKEMDESARVAFREKTKASLLKLLSEIDSDKAKRYAARIYHNELSSKCLAYIIAELNLPFVLKGKRGHKILEALPDPNLTPTADSDLRELKE